MFKKEFVYLKYQTIIKQNKIMSITRLNHKNEIINRISEERYDMLPRPSERTMSQRAYTKIVVEATKKVIKKLYREGIDLHEIQKATKEEGGNFYKAFVELYGKKLTY